MSDIGTKRELIWKTDAAPNTNPFTQVLQKDIEQAAVDP